MDDSARIFQDLVNATKEQALCEYALRTAKMKLDAAQADLEEANNRVERAQQELSRLARRGIGIVEDEPTAERPLTQYIPVRR